MKVETDIIPSIAVSPTEWDMILVYFDLHNCCYYISTLISKRLVFPVYIYFSSTLNAEDDVSFSSISVVPGWDSFIPPNRSALKYKSVYTDKALNKSESCINLTLKKVPMKKIFVKLTCLNQTPVYTEHKSLSQGGSVRQVSL